MSARPSKEFNQKAPKPRSHVYTVRLQSAATARKKDKDYTADTLRMIARIEKQAVAEGFEGKVRLNPEETLSRAGMFFMKAPEKFAAIVRKMEGISSVRKPAEKKSAIPAARR